MNHPTPVPETRETLIHALGKDATSPRWNEFYARYQPMMKAYLASRFPTLDSEADVIVQETLLALVKVLPNYRYSPAETGAFHNYLTGILRNKACAKLRELRRAAVPTEGLQEREMASAWMQTPATPDDIVSERDEDAWRQTVFEIALRQLLADETVQERTKQVFSRIAIRGEDPAAVAKAFGLTANAVAQIRFRMTQRLRDIAKALEMVDSGETGSCPQKESSSQ